MGRKKLEAMELKNAITEWLSDVDKELSNVGMPVRRRILRAAILFSKDCVVEEAHDDEDVFEKPWFALVYSHVKNWYQEYYGPMLEGGGLAYATGVVLVRDIPVRVRVPLTRSTLETPGETAWLHFPVTIEEAEDPESWLIDPPPLEKLKASERSKISRKLTTVCEGLRRVRINFMGIKPDDEIIDNLLSGVISDLESAADQILRADDNGRGAAFWSLQMAVEKALKAFGQHKVGEFQRTHNLFALYDDVRGYGIAAKRNLLTRMPRERQVMDYRYGMGGTPGIPEIMKAYEAALAVVSQASQSFGRDVSIGGGRILLKKPQWV